MMCLYKKNLLEIEKIFGVCGSVMHSGFEICIRGLSLYLRFFHTFFAFCKFCRPLTPFLNGQRQPFFLFLQKFPTPLLRFWTGQDSFLIAILRLRFWTGKDNFVILCSYEDLSVIRPIILSLYLDLTQY